MKITFEDQTN